MPAPRIPRTVAHGKPKPDPRRRMQHLTFVRQLSPASPAVRQPPEAGHVRSGSDAGVEMKPSDRYSVYLCIDCHELQHQFGELTFWSVLHIDPLNVAFRLWTVSGNIKAGKRIVFRARQQNNLMKDG
jgi:hypothetical protein